MRTRTTVRVAIAALSLLAIALLVHRAGVDTFLVALAAALPFVPALLLLEAVRILADIIALWSLCGPDAARVTLREWVRLHLEANAACVVLPGGRAVSEGLKIARLGPALGRGRIAALIATQHAINMVTIALVGACGAVAAGRSILGGAILIHATATLAGALALRASLSRADLPRWAASRVGASEATLNEFRATARATAFFPLPAVVAKGVNRLAQVAQFALLLAAVGATPSMLRALLANGVSLLGGVLGELSLAQLGCTDGAFALSASTLSISIGGAVAIASLARFVQLTWSAVGSALALVGKGNRHVES